MKAISIILVWLVLVGCAWGQPIEGGIEKIEGSERLEWIHYEPPPAGWVKCDSEEITKPLFNLRIYKNGKGCVTVGDSVGQVTWATIFLNIKMEGWDVSDSYILEFNVKPKRGLSIYQPRTDRKNVTEKFIKVRRK